MNTRTIFAAAVIVFSLLFSNSAVAEAIVSKNSTQDEWLLCWNSVELVYVSGWVQVVRITQADRAGGTRDVFQVTFHGFGVGAISGEQYVWHGTRSDTHVSNAAGGEARTYMARVRLISRGWYWNNQEWVDVHFTVTPDEIVVNSWDLYECAVY